MSTRISGDAEDVFDALRNAFVRLAKEGQVVLTVKASNACPEDVASEHDGKRRSDAGTPVPGSDVDQVSSSMRRE